MVEATAISQNTVLDRLCGNADSTPDLREVKHTAVICLPAVREEFTKLANDIPFWISLDMAGVSRLRASQL